MTNPYCELENEARYSVRTYLLSIWMKIFCTLGGIFLVIETLKDEYDLDIPVIFSTISIYSTLLCLIPLPFLWLLPENETIDRGRKHKVIKFVWFLNLIGMFAVFLDPEMMDSHPYISALYIITVLAFPMTPILSKKAELVRADVIECKSAVKECKNRTPADEYIKSIDQHNPKIYSYICPICSTKQPHENTKEIERVLKEETKEMSSFKYF